MENKMINKKYRVTATILTPLHIGAGAEKDWVEGVDYVRSEDGIMWHLDMRKMLEAGIDVNRMAQIFASGKASNEIIRLFGNKLKQFSDFSMPMPISSNNPIKVFLRNQLTGRPIIAGSSLKGAIRSILFTYLRERGETRNDEVFGKLNDGSDFMRFIRVGDIEFEKTCLLNSKIYDLNTEGTPKGGWKSRGKITTDVNPTEFNTIYECLLPNNVSEGCVLLAEQLFDTFNRQQPYQNKKCRLIHSLYGICEIVRNHTLDYIDKELDFFEKYEQGQYSVDIYNSLIDIQEAIEGCNSNECVLKMSAGSGFHSITGDWQFDDFVNGTFDRKRNRGNNILPKSRKTIFCKGLPTLMGFVKLSFEEVTE